MQKRKKKGLLSINNDYEKGPGNYISIEKKIIQITRGLCRLRESAASVVTSPFGRRSGNESVFIRQRTLFKISL